jgi:RNA polymerase sigma-70 factor, ECF subfamily
MAGPNRTPLMNNPKHVPPADSDQMLLARLATDLDAAFESLVLAYQQPLFAFALRATCSRPDAEEIVQDAFVRAYRALHGYSRERIIGLALRAWLFQIVMNLIRNRVRGKHLLLEAIDTADGQPRVESGDREWERPEAIVERREQSVELEKLLSSLSDRYRIPVLLRHVIGLGYTDVARILDQPVGTVKANVHRGIQMLRQTMSQELHEVRQ